MTIRVLIAWLALTSYARAEPPCEGAIAAREQVFMLVRGDAVVGAGFSYRYRDVLVTAEHVAETGPTHAVDPDGRRHALGKRIRDVRNDVAIYRLANSSAQAPLVAEPHPSIGSPVFSIGHPRPRGMSPTARAQSLNWSISRGTVTGADDSWIVADATVFGGNSGGPLVSCDGRVVGVASHATNDLRFVWASRVRHVDALLDRGTDGPLARVRDLPPRHWTVAARVGGNDQLGLGATLHWPWRSYLWFNAGFAATTNALTGDAYGSGRENQFRSTLEASFRWHPFERWNFDPQLALGIGVTAARTSTLALDGTTTVERDIAPSLSLSIAFDRLTLGASVDVDVADPGTSQWWLWLGWKL